MTVYTGKVEVFAVQARLKELGYVEISEVDGKLGDVTKDVLLSFRRRNGLPLVAQIDDALLETLRSAPPKVLPDRVLEATPEHLETRVGAMATTVAAKKASWWGQFWAWLVTVPTGVFTLLVLMLQNLQSAVDAVRPLKEFLSELPIVVWGGAVFAVALALAIQAGRTARLADETEDAILTGYREGTVKNDKDVV